MDFISIFAQAFHSSEYFLKVMIPFTRIYNLIPYELRAKGWSVLFSTLFTSLLDLVGIATLFPLLLLVLQPSSERIRQLQLFLKRSGIELSSRELLYATIVILMLFLVLKNIITYLLHNRTAAYLATLYQYMTEKLFENFCHRDILNLRQQQSSEISMTINQTAYNFAWSIVLPCLALISDFILFFSIILATTLISPQSTIVAILFLVPLLWLIIVPLRGKIVELGTQEYNARVGQIRTTFQTFRGFAEVCVYDAYNYQKQRFLSNVTTSTEARKELERLSRIPGAILETGVAIGLCILALMVQGEVSTVIILFGAASLRIIPSLRSLIGSWKTLKNNQHSLEQIEETLNYKYEIKSKNTLIFEHTIVAKNISFAFTNKQVIDHLSFTIHKGDRVMLSGESGRGKSTLIHLLVGLYPLNNGVIEIDGITLNNKNISAWQSLIGYVPQDVFLFDGTLAENIAFGKEDIDFEKVEQLLEHVNLTERLHSLPYGIHSTIGENGCLLSGGERQRVGIARALYRTPQVLVLDEATSAIDKITEQEIFLTISAIAKQNTELTIIAISHHNLPWNNNQTIQL